MHNLSQSHGQEDPKLRELLSVMENWLVENNVLHDKMLKLMNEKKDNDDKVVQIIEQVKEQLHTQPYQRDCSNGMNGPVVSLNVTNIIRNVFTDIYTVILSKIGLNRIFNRKETNIKTNEFTRRSDSEINVDIIKKEIHLVTNIETTDDIKNLCTRENKSDGNTIKDKKIYSGNEGNENPNEKHTSKGVIEDMEHMSNENMNRLLIKPSESFGDNISNDLTRYGIKGFEEEASTPLDFTENQDHLRNEYKNRLLIKPSDSFGDNINKDLSKCSMKGLEASTPLDFTENQDRLSGKFVFSTAEKPDVSSKGDIPGQSMLPLMSFADKKFNLALKMKEEKVAAIKGDKPPFELVDGTCVSSSNNATFIKYANAVKNEEQSSSISSFVPTSSTQDALEGQLPVLKITTDFLSPDRSATHEVELQQSDGLLSRNL